MLIRKRAKTSSNMLSDGQGLFQQLLPIQLLLTIVQHGRVPSKPPHQQTAQ